MCCCLYEYFTAMAGEQYHVMQTHLLFIHQNVNFHNEIQWFVFFSWGLRRKKTFESSRWAFFGTLLRNKFYAPFTLHFGSLIRNPTFISSISWHINHHVSPYYWCPSSILCQSVVLSLFHFKWIACFIFSFPAGCVSAEHPRESVLKCLKLFHLIERSKQSSWSERRYYNENDLLLFLGELPRGTISIERELLMAQRSTKQLNL